jgi:hypothetical protein
LRSARFVIINAATFLGVLAAKLTAGLYL